MKAVRPVTASNGMPSLQMTSVGSHSTSGRDKEGKKVRKGVYISHCYYYYTVTSFSVCDTT